MSTFREVMQTQGPGAQKQLAEAVGVTPQAVHLWVKKGRVPAERVLVVASHTGIPAHELRPDLYPAPVAAPA